MSYKVELLIEAQDDLLALDRDQQSKVVKGLLKLEIAPEQFGAPLGSQKDSNLTGFRKLVVGNQNIRIVYRIEKQSVVIVWVIAARAEKKCYKMAKARIDSHPDRDLAGQLESVLTTAWTDVNDDS
ncbi:MAG: type II toxin-antitoxin system RelE/ParE family toxin [Rhodococcus erythropolis]